MHFEFDQVKIRCNKAKHGIGFAAAPALWFNTMLIEIAKRLERTVSSSR